MAEPWEKYFDLEAFQNEVNVEIYALSASGRQYESPEIGLPEADSIGNGEIKRSEENKALELTKQKIVLDRLCPALLTLSDDVFEVAKFTTPILLTLAFAGTIAIPLQPSFFAVVALLISRMGIATLCADYEKEKDKE